MSSVAPSDNGMFQDLPAAGWMAGVFAPGDAQPAQKIHSPRNMPMADLRGVAGFMMPTEETKNRPRASKNSSLYGPAPASHSITNH